MVPFLLTMPAYGGTLAAARALGRSGIPVTVAADEWIAPARWSRYATRVVRCASPTSFDRFLDWLLGFGKYEGRHVLYPTSDDQAFLIAANARALAEYFDLYQPSVQTLVRLLDKKALAEACRSVGVPVPQSWFPRDEADIVRIAREARFPVVIKARTQVCRVKQTKGVVVEGADHLLAGYRSFLSQHEYRPGLAPHFEDVRQPMVQHYCRSGGQRIYSLSGFVHRDGKVLGARASEKIYQRTQPVGLGVCFETAAVDPALVDAVERLCAEVGHFGVFEVEFVREEGTAMVIDFNPRFYSQMAFEIERGLPLPLLAYHAARGDDEALRGIAARAAASSDGAKIYTQRFIFELILLVERLGGTLSASEYARWRRWHSQNRARAADVFADPDDPLPGLCHVVNEVASGFRALPRVFLSGKRSPRYA
jgi:predicted ATP-grasp superfamily ATP-dependent carboligase